ncbi:hypothetical protein ANCCAN_07182 [Ancylostoma caninum]|uniref:Methyltransferase domain-containing protein n=1 Tax=Ancylostoma caninum TaxID=29170 RepID=A0A368GUL7_ANCCA|nr:hypothetical protein ANCCAN_07182 [Ancylostoma caninum]
MARFSTSITTVVLMAVILIYMCAVFRPEITILSMTPPAPPMEPLPLSPKYQFVEKRLALKPNFTSTAPVSKPSSRMIELYRIQAKQRRAYLKVVLMSLSRNYMFVYNNLAPEVYCPELVRVGTTNDGGKWICSPFRIPIGCTIFSLGLFNEVTFEMELQYILNNRCKIFAYDSNEQATATLDVLKTIRTKAMKATIGSETDTSRQSYTIEDLMNMESVNNIEIFKIDIEGSEFAVVPAFLKKHKPAQILIEIHGTPAEMVTLLNDISRQGYWLYSHEINGAWHNLCEFSFIHEKAFERYGATPMAKYLDIV